MAWRTEPGVTSTIHFMVPAALPSMVYEACCLTKTPSNNRYVQEALCRRLADDLGLDLDELLASLPPTRPVSKEFNGHRNIGPANTVEEVV